MQLKKIFISQTLVDGTVSGGTDDGGNPASVVYPAVPVGTYGTGMLDGQRAIMIRNDGMTTATFWMQAPGSAAFVPNKNQLTGDATGMGTISVPPGKTAILPNGGFYCPFSYVGGPVLVMNGTISYTVDMDPNDPSAVVWA